MQDADMIVSLFSIFEISFTCGAMVIFVRSVMDFSHMPPHAVRAQYTLSANHAVKTATENLNQPLQLLI